MNNIIDNEREHIFPSQRNTKSFWQFPLVQTVMINDKNNQEIKLSDKSISNKNK